MPREKSKTKTLLVLDMHGLIHRAYHALPDFRSRAGEPTGALYGLSNMLLKAIKTFEPDYVAAAFDMPGPTFRHVVYEDYKATRKKADDDLVHQLRRAHDVVAAFGMEEFSKSGFEADDIVGTIVEQTKKVKDLRVVIVSGDADTFQLVDGERVVVYTMRKGIEDTIVYDKDMVLARFGFEPKLLPDYKGLRGDTSDNIKGVPGIGEKTGTELIKHFGSIEALYKALSKKDFTPPVFLKARILELLRTHKEDALFSKELATIRRDVPISFMLPSKTFSIPEDSMTRMFEELGFQSLLKRFRGVQQASLTEQGLHYKSSSEASQSLPADSIYRDVDADTEAFWKEVARTGVIHVTYKDGKARVRAEGLWGFPGELLAGATQSQGEILAQKIIVTDDGKQFVKEYVSRKWPMPSGVFDCLIVAWICDSTLTNMALTEERFLHTSKHPDDVLGILPLLYEALKKEIRKGKLAEVYETIERPLQYVLARMEQRGIRVDQDFFLRLKKDLTKEQKKLETGIFKDAGQEFNINSPLQVGEIIFQKLELGTDKVKKTSTGRISTRESELSKLRDQHPIIAKVLDYREITKVLSTYVEPLSQLAAISGGSIHSTFNQTGTVTGRLSSDSPNLQNIPIRSELGARVREGFVVRPGFVLVAFDYAQIELKILASCANDEKMINAFRERLDIHTATAATINHVSISEVTPQMRSRAKAINFGIIYGMGVRQLGQNTGMTQTEAATFYREYFESFPRIRSYIDATKALVYKQGYVETLFGRRRYFNLKQIQGNRFLEAEMERMAVNAVIQGTDADIMKHAMIMVDAACSSEDVFPLVQIHDEMIYEIRKDTLDINIEKIKKTMEEIMLLKAPLSVHIKVGASWGTMKAY